MSEKTFKIVNGDISDGYHTFDELYDHRCLLWIAWFISGVIGGYWVREHYEGWDLLVAHLSMDNTNQISYHVPKKYRKLYEHKLEIGIGDHKFDGHTPVDVLKRIEKFLSRKP